MAEAYICEGCRESIRSEEASTCPHCGYEPAAGHRKAATRQGIIAALLIFSVIGSPLGVWVWWRSHKHRKKAEQATPAIPVS